MTLSAGNTPCDAWLSQFYGKMPFEDYLLLDRAARTLEGNVAKGNKPWSPLRGIRPSCIIFPGVWNWDSAFHALGVSRWNPELARDQIRIFCHFQQPSGLFPDVLFEDGRIINRYGKPPILPWAAAILEQRSPNPDFRELCITAFRRNETFWRKNRTGEKIKLFHYDADGGNPEERIRDARYESGWDNSVRWDDGISNLFAIDLNCYMVLFYRAMRILDPSQIWEIREQELVRQIEETLWNEADQCYEDRNMENGEFNGVITPASFMPLFIGSASPERAAAMAKIAEKHEMPGWPSVSYRDSSFDPEGYWRGRTWLNIAYFALKGLKNYRFDSLADQGRNTLLNWVRAVPGFLCENYHPVSGKPIGAAHFGWSATFVIEFLLNWNSELPLTGTRQK